MTGAPPRQPDEDPRSPVVLDDQIAAYDCMRGHCPVAHSDYLHWSVFRHADGLRVLEDHDSFSNVVSLHPTLPNGVDPPEHTAYRALIPDSPSLRATFPAGGFTALPFWVEQCS
ncbi:MAG: cytochrome [Microvirga sp.]|nr:cytochrome [Microvirga sp.]MDF2984095.1 cytochrome [Devosia sp.]